jgi:hypothetical protein
MARYGDSFTFFIHCENHMHIQYVGRMQSFSVLKRVVDTESYWGAVFFFFHMN